MASAEPSRAKSHRPSSPILPGQPLPYRLGKVCRLLTKEPIRWQEPAR